MRVNLGPTPKQIVAATIAGLEYSYRPQVFAIIEAAVFYSDPIEITPGRIKTDRIYQSAFVLDMLLGVTEKRRVMNVGFQNSLCLTRRWQRCPYS